MQQSNTHTAEQTATLNGPDTALLKAAEEGNKHQIRYWLRNGAYIHAQDADGLTALHHAAAAESPIAVEYLLQQGANVHSPDRSGQTPLFHACYSSQMLNAFYLLGAGADIEARDKQGNTPLHIVTACYSNRAALPLLIAAGADVNARQEVSGTTPIMKVIYSCGEDENECNQAIQSLSLLLAAGADINLADACGQTPLIYSVRTSTPAAITGFLLRNGACVHATDAGGFSALCYALATEQTQTAALLRKHGAAEPPEQALQNCRLHTAINKGDTLTALDALTKGADANARNHAGEPPLLQAMYLHGDTLPGMEPIIVALLQAGAHPDAGVEDGQGATPLSIAAEFGRIYTMHRLIEAGARINSFDEERVTPLMSAAKFNIPEAVALLLHSGAYTFMSNAKHQTAADIAREYHSKECWELLEKPLSEIQAPEEPQPSNDAQEALHYAITHGDIPRYHAALQAGASPAKPFANGASPLFCAVRFNQPLCLKLILEAKAPLLDNLHFILQRAISSESSACLQLLLEAFSADITKSMLVKLIRQATYCSLPEALKLLRRAHRDMLKKKTPAAPSGEELA